MYLKEHPEFDFFLGYGFLQQDINSNDFDDLHPADCSLNKYNHVIETKNKKKY